MCPGVSETNDSRHNRPLTMVISDSRMLFIQCWLNLCGIFDHTLVTTENLRWFALWHRNTKHLNLKRKCSMASRDTLSAIKSAENALVSTVCGRLLYYTIGARLRKTTYPVCDRLRTLFAACDALTNAFVVSLLPWGYGIYVAFVLWHHDRILHNHLASFGTLRNWFAATQATYTAWPLDVSARMRRCEIVVQDVPIVGLPGTGKAEIPQVKYPRDQSRLPMVHQLVLGTM